MIVINFFNKLLSNIGEVVAFVTDKNEVLSDLFGQDTNILDLLSIFLVGFLLVALALHVAHLINPVG